MLNKFITLKTSGFVRNARDAAGQRDAEIAPAEAQP